MKKKYNVYGVGNALVDIEFKVEYQFLKKHAIEKGLMTLIDEERQISLISAMESNIIKKEGGGSAANTLIGLSQFGGKGYYACKVGNDAEGKFYIKELENAGVKTNLTSTPLDNIATGKCLVMITPDSERTMNTFLGATLHLEASVVDENIIKQSEYVYIEGYLITSPKGKEVMRKTKKLAEKHNVKIAITLSDPSIIASFKEDFDDIIGSGVDLLFCNEEEAMQYTGTNTLIEARKKMKDSATRFAITLGKNGAIIFDGDTFIDMEPYTVLAIDSNGAGDMFAGAFLYAITNGHTYASAGKIATLASSKIVAKFGPRLANEQAKTILESMLL